MLSRLRLWARPPALTLERLRAETRYPILDAAQLVGLLGQDNRLRTIRRLASVDPEAFAQLYQPALDRYLECAQLQPASTVDHHAGLGGLAVHTLEVVELTMKERKQYLLPQNAAPEVIAREEHCWTYAVFAAALLHDAGKLLTLTRLKLDTGEHWTAAGRPLGETGATHYEIEFVRAPYALQRSVSTLLFDLLPPLARDMLVQNARVLEQLSAWLAGDDYRCGLLGELAGRADALSVARYRQPGQKLERLPHAPVRPLVERLTRALRALVEDGTLKFNHNGASGWCDGHFLWITCKVAAREVAHRLAAEGSRDIPQDDTRLFDAWQDHGHLVPTEEGRAVWTVRIEGADFAHTLTVLKFELSHLVRRGRTIATFDGTVTPLNATEARAARDSEPAAERPIPAAPPTDAPTDAPTPERSPPAASAPRPDDGTATGTFALAPSPPDPAPGTPDTAEPETEAAAAESGVDHLAGALRRAASREVGDIFCDPVPLDDDRIGNYFLTWLRDNVAAGRFAINQQKAMVHIVPEGVALVTPKVFQHFITSEKLIQSQENAAVMKAVQRVQNRLRRRKLVLPNPKGFSVTRAIVHAGRGTSTVSVIVVPFAAVYPDREPPDPNPVLSLEHGAA